MPRVPRRELRPEANHSQIGQFSDGAVVSGSGVLVQEGGITRTFQAIQGTPITHFMTGTGPLDNSAYSVYYVLEQLE